MHTKAKHDHYVLCKSRETDGMEGGGGADSSGDGTQTEIRAQGFSCILYDFNHHLSFIITSYICDVLDTLCDCE